MRCLLGIKTILVAILVSVWLPSEACRFTVREIGFSTLSQTNYTLVVIDSKTEQGSRSMLESLQRRHGKNSNIGVLHLNEHSDSHNPIVRLAKDKGLSTPSVFLLSPDNRIHPIKHNQSVSVDWKAIKNHFESSILDSPLRKRLRNETETTFAYVICIDGQDAQESQNAFDLLTESCRQLKEMMPLMPKEVEDPPVVLRLTKDEFDQESTLLWSLGLDSLNGGEPQAVIVYGRGRVMGNVLDYKQIEEGMAYNYLSMIGADCECGLDRKWMLGVQIPLVWDADCRRRLAVELGFDVDNPTILAEMSRIMAKESVEDNASGVGYGLESIDLNEAFGIGINDSKPKVEQVEGDSGTARFKAILSSLLLLVVISVVVSVVIIIIRRRRKM